MPSVQSSRYRHLAEGEIRLLTLLPGALNDIPNCNLNTVLLGSEVEYEALSYAWGDKEEMRTMRIDQRETNSTKNLYIALQHLKFKQSTRRVLWIDAICINQEDLHERNQQVQLMAEIYRNASRVLVWLGEQDQDSSRAFDFVEKWCQPPRSILWPYISAKYNLDSSQFDSHMSSKALQAEARSGSVVKGGPPTSHTFLEHVRSMGYPSFNYMDEDPSLHECLAKTFDLSGGRSWWTRRWVIQEVLFAQDILIVCGNRALSWDDLQAVQDGIAYNSASIYPMRYSIEKSLRHAWMIGTMRRMTELSKNTSRKFSLLEAIHFFGYAQCSDPRDVIFSILNFVNTVLSADYTMTVPEVYTIATKSIISQSRSLLCLTYPSTASAAHLAAVPSWVRNWESQLKSSALLTVLDFPTVYDSGASTQVKDSFDESSCSSALLLRGALHDNIVSATVLLESSESESNATDIIRAWEPPWTDLLPYPTGENGFDAFWRTLQRDLHHFGNLDPKLRSKRPRDFGYQAKDRIKTSHIEGYRRYYEWFTARRQTETEQEINAEMDRLSLYEKNPIIGRGCTLEYLQGYCFITTQSRYMGVVQGQARVGDKVYVVEGSIVPLILRRCEESFTKLAASGELLYNFVGAAYVHGIMDGEVMHAVAMGEKNIESLVMI